MDNDQTDQIIQEYQDEESKSEHPSTIIQEYMSEQ